MVILQNILAVIITSCVIIIFSSFIHPEIVTEQFGVISRERTTFYDYLIMVFTSILIITIIYFNYIHKSI
jgi:hypothetical protein